MQFINGFLAFIMLGLIFLGPSLLILFLSGYYLLFREQPKPKRYINSMEFACLGISLGLFVDAVYRSIVHG